MKSHFAAPRRIFPQAVCFSLLAWAATCLLPGAGEPQVRILQGSDAVEVRVVAPNIVRIQLQPNAQTTARTLVMDPSFQPVGTGSVRLEKNGAVQTLSSDEMKVVVNGATPFSVDVQDPY
jgi:hypothetical protein